jgi:GxxExxY protein
MRYEEETGKILEACFEVSKELGAGFLESVYEKALLISLAQKGLHVESQVRLKVYFKGGVWGKFSADILVENKVIVEVKAIESLLKKHYAQAIN